jgi:ABC-2 type transport system permease protein
MLGAVFMPAILTGVETEETYTIDIIDRSGIVFEELNKRMNPEINAGKAKYIFTNITMDQRSDEDLISSAKEKIKKELLDGVLFIPSAVIDSAKMEYYTRNVTNFNLNRQIKSTVNDIVTEQRIAKSGLDPKTVKQLTRWIDMTTVKVKEGEEDKESGFLEEYFVTLAFVMILYVTILIYGATIMRGVLEEKNSRVIEVLLSSANSFQLMVGKIIGLGSVGLSQYIIWSVLGLSISLYGGAMSGLPMDKISFDPMIFLYFILFFLLGYFLYATIYAAFGAMSNSDQEAQQASFPVVMLLIIPLVMMTFIVKNPQSTVSTVMSIIPFFSPILMFARINTATPTPLEIWGSIILLVLTTIFSIWVVSRIYRIGILSYGKKPTFGELYRWIRTK